MKTLCLARRSRSYQVLETSECVSISAVGDVTEDLLEDFFWEVVHFWAIGEVATTESPSERRKMAAVEI